MAQAAADLSMFVTHNASAYAHMDLAVEGVEPERLGEAPEAHDGARRLQLVGPRLRVGQVAEGRVGQRLGLGHLAVHHPGDAAPQQRGDLAVSVGAHMFPPPGSTVGRMVSDYGLEVLPITGSTEFAALLAAPGILLIVIGAIVIGKTGKKPVSHSGSGEEQWRRSGR